MVLMGLYLCMGRRGVGRRLLCWGRKKLLFSIMRWERLKRLSSLLLMKIPKIMEFCCIV